MTRVEFVTLEEAEVWVQDKVYDERKGQYRVYWDHVRGHVIFEPRVSTDPMTYGLVYKVSRKDIEEFAKTHTDIKVIPCFRYAWDSRREPVDVDVV